MLQNNEWDKIKNMSDGELQDKISIAVKAMGDGKADLQLSDDDLEKIKSAVRGMKLSDINAMMQTMDTKTVSKLRQSLTDNT